MRLVVTVVLLAVAGAEVAQAADTQDTRLLSEPAISARHVAFIYAGDLWSARLDGSEVRRLTAHEGRESNPRFSPDGSVIAFSAEYDGNTDVYVVPVAGGEPIRLTWHPADDTVRDFGIDGRSVLFASPRNVHTNRHSKLFSVPIDGGQPRELPIPHAFKAAYAPDGKRIAYTPLAERFRQWKNYRGGTVSRIWIYDSETHDVVELPQPEGRSNDTDPMWIQDRLYFISDRAGEFNLFSYDEATGAVSQLTRHDDFPIQAASAGAGRIIYEQAGYLHVFDPSAGTAKRLVLGVAADLEETRPRYEKGERFIRDRSLSPTAARTAFEFRGEIVTLPEAKGDPRNITNTPGAHERSPVWSPDGQHIAYLSDASGEYELHIAPQDGRGDVRRLPLKGSGFYQSPKWSPDGKKLSYWDNSLGLYWLDLESGAITKVGAQYRYSPIRFFHHAWSADSQWLTYTLDTEAYMQRVYVYSLEQNKSYPVTDGLSDVAEPIFDPSGKYLYFLVSTDAGPAKHWFAMSNADADISHAIYVAVLHKGVPSPLAKESDEEVGFAGEGEGEGEAESEPAPESEEAPAVRIDFDGLDQRILALPVPRGFMSQLSSPAEGEIYFLRAPSFRGASPASATLHRFTFADRKTEDLAAGVNDYEIARDGKKLLYHTEGGWAIAPTGAKIDPSQGKLAVDRLEVRVDPRAEWRQIFREAWRINRDYFYDPNMHGADWQAMSERYEGFLADVTNRDDLNRIIQWMCSELSVGHHRVGGGDTRDEAEPIAGGLLGADFAVVNGRYRFAKVYGGLNWNPELRSPLTEPGVDVVAGEYLLAVEGRDLRPPENLYSHFEKTAETIVNITVGPNADGTGSRVVAVVPIADELALRNRDWVEGNLRKVDQATGGRVAYVYVPNTTTLGHEYFKRYFFPQSNKEAIIVDERYNGGGQVADYYIDLLRRPFISHWATRYGADIDTPSAAIHGPKVMLIDETAGSGGDLLPWMFRKLALGKLIGKRTWGGLVGILGFPVLMDGGFVTAPDLAIWTEDGYVVENVGVPPDIEVEQLPKDVIAGHDPQLEKAIEVVMEELEATPTSDPKRPSYPVRVRR